jgi:hypothetical protein
VRSRRKAAAATAVALAALLALAAEAFGLPPFSTTPQTSSASGGQAQLSGIDTGCHNTFDRFVIRVGSGNPGYDVRYVGRIIADPSGRTVSLQGSKRIRVVIRPARGHTAGGANLLPSTVTPRCPNLRQVKKAGDFEGVVSFGLGLSNRTGFRVFRLTGPTRIVVDVAH